MGFFDGLTGRRSVRNINAASQEAEDRLMGGRNRARDAYNQGTDSALSEIRPYQQHGQRGFSLYNDALGVNGGQAQQSAYGTYSQSPFLAAQRGEGDNRLRQMFQKYNAQGMGNSGMNRLATARAAQGFERDNQNDWMGRLGQVGQMGGQFATQAAGLQSGRGQYLADLENGLGQQLAGNSINRANAVNAAQNQGINNLIGLGSTLFGAGMTAFGGPTPRMAPGSIPSWNFGTTMMRG